MTLEDTLLLFTNLHEVATLGADPYRRQDTLVLHYREHRKPFLAVMPLRHVFRCSDCGLQQGEAVMHFEDPRRPATNQQAKVDEAPLWPTAGASFIEAKRSELHATVAHGQALREEIRLFFEQVV